MIFEYSKVKFIFPCTVYIFMVLRYFTCFIYRMTLARVFEVNLESIHETASLRSISRKNSKFSLRCCFKRDNIKVWFNVRNFFNHDNHPTIDSTTIWRTTTGQLSSGQTWKAEFHYGMLPNQALSVLYGGPLPIMGDNSPCIFLICSA